MISAQWRASGVEGTSLSSVTTLRHLSENAVLHFRGGRLSRGAGYAAASKDARQSLARVGAILRLRQHNRYYVHSSAVVDGRGDAIMFVGPSGSGKSTLAFALARAGWSMLGDDGVVLEPLADSIVAHGWRSQPLVSQSLSPIFPELRDRESDVIAGDARRRVPLTAVHIARARLAKIVFVSQGDSSGVQRCSEPEALSSIVGESPWVLLGDADSGAHFEALARIVSSVPCFKFVHGPAELRRIGDLFESAA